ncbi:MAG: Trk system potassium transporter TrkA [bacterium]|nr:Trk system potassium transporter TrkA [bacterium]
MRIIILGAGEVGSHLAKTLKRYRHEVIVIDNDTNRLEKLATQTDIQPVNGSGTSPQILRDAGLAETDILIAVTAIDEVNILACTLANQMKVPLKIARVRNQEYANLSKSDLLHRFGIDLLVTPEKEAAKEIANLLRNNHAVEYQEFSNGKLKLIGTKITSGSSLVSRKLADLNNLEKRFPFSIHLIQRMHKTIFCDLNTQIEKDDVVYATVEENGDDRFYSVCGHETERVRNIMIYGASEVGAQVGYELENEKRVRIKIIEPISERAHSIARNLSKALVMQGEGTDIDLLAAEGLIQMDAFVATTDNDEKNIVSCLLARHLGVQRVITLIHRAEYLPIFRTIGLDIPINLRLLTANTILRKLEQGPIQSTTSIRGVDCEAFLFECEKGMRIENKHISDLQLPENSKVSAIIRNETVLFPDQTTTIQPSDKVFILAKHSALPNLLKLFR